MIYLLNVAEQRCFILRPDEQRCHFYNTYLPNDNSGLVDQSQTYVDLAPSSLVCFLLTAFSRSVESRKSANQASCGVRPGRPWAGDREHQSWAHCGTFSSRVAQEDGVGALVPSPAAGGSRCNFSTVNSISQHAER